MSGQGVERTVPQSLTSLTRCGRAVAKARSHRANLGVSEMTRERFRNSVTRYSTNSRRSLRLKELLELLASESAVDNGDVGTAMIPNACSFWRLGQTDIHQMRGGLATPVGPLFSEAGPVHAPYLRSTLRRRLPGRRRCPHCRSIGGAHGSIVPTLALDLERSR